MADHDVPAPDRSDDLERVSRELAEELAEVEEETAGLGQTQTPELLPASGPLRSGLHWIGNVEQAIGTGFIVVILGLVLLQVAQRYLPGGGWAWTGEVARLSMVWATFILSGYLLAHDRHIAIQVVDLVLPDRVLGVVKLLVHIVILAVCIGLAYAIYSLIADDIGQRTAAAEIPFVYVYVLPLVGFILTALRAALGIVILDLPQIAGREGAAR